MKYCHTEGIIHRDIKLENILINEKGEIKICDFGISKRINKDELLKDCCGTPAYIAPEVLEADPYDGYMADMWSVGIVLYTMLYGKFPFRAKEENELKEKILDGNFELDESISLEARSLISRLLNQIPVLRPSIEEVFEDRWMTNIDTSCILML